MNKKKTDVYLQDILESIEYIEQFLNEVSEILSAHGIESKHTLDLPKKNAIPDPDIEQA